LVLVIFLNTALVLQCFIVLQPGIPQKNLLTTLQMPNALIIDDETDIWMLLSRILRKHNFSTYFVNNLEAATKRLQQEVPAIIYLDNHLPDGLGLDFIQFLKTQYPQTKIVMITGHSSQADRNKAFNQGADMFLSKPFSSEAIRDTITSLL
jgi:two-component system, OmpR family, response regulator